MEALVNGFLSRKLGTGGSGKLGTGGSGKLAA